MLIVPTIGRVVWYHPSPDQRIEGQPNDQLCAALVAYVWGDRMVNLTVSTPNGQTYGVTSVDLLQEGDPARGGTARGETERWCQWMPYQVGQAKKHEPSAAELGAAVRAAGLTGP
jgi:hypothetical protein